MRHKGVSYAKYGYFFSIPFVIAFLLFWLYPVLYTTVIGFTDMKGLFSTGIHFLADPFQNFKSVIANPSFKVSLSNTAVIWIINFLPQIGLALILTAWFTSTRRKIKGQGAFKVLFYMPNIITAATIGILFGSLFGYPVGPVNDLYKIMGWSDEPVNFLLNGWTAKGIVAFIQFWMWYGYTMIILIAGVLGINPELFEAAEIDGASSAQTFFRITLPNLKTIMLFTLVTSLIGGLQMFDIPRLFLQGGPDSATLTSSLFIYNQAFSGSYLYNRAAAASMILFILVTILSSIIFYIMRDKDEVKLRKEKRAQIKAYKRAEKASGGVAR